MRHLFIPFSSWPHVASRLFISGLIPLLLILFSEVADCRVDGISGMTAKRAEILRLIQARTNTELKSDSEITVRSWTNTTDYVLVVAKPQASMFHDRVIFALVKQNQKAKKTPNWKIIDFKVTRANENPLKIWEKKYKFLPKDVFMLAQIALHIED
ncbi:MAG: hypothetical protein ACK5WZ_11255 [Pseudobdellovibrionaceae bacterium]|jgi:hypothetical protein